MKTSHNTFQYVPPSVYKSLDMLPMLQAVSAGLALLEPWISTNRDKFPAKIEPFVDKVRGQSEKYHEALTDSARVAQSGYNWTLDMERYCTVLKRRSGNNKLLKRGSSNTKLLNEYVKLMREGARNAQQQAEQLSGKFLRVSAGLRQIETDAKKVAELSAETIKALDAQIQENNEKWEKAVKRANTFGNVCDTLSVTMLVGSAFLGPVSFLATLTDMAIGRGIGHLICEADERLNDNRLAMGIAKTFGATAENCPAATALLAQKALTELEVVYYLASVIEGIEHIVKHVDAIAKWWDTMHTQLEGIETTGLARLDGNIGTMSVAMMQDTVSSVQESIKERKEEFKEYINQVHAVQARNPPPRFSDGR